LAGLSDADSNFNITFTKRKNINNIRIQISYRLELKQKFTNNINNDDSYFDICLQISKFLNVSFYTRTRKLNNNEFNFFLIVAHNQKSQEIISKYLSTYKLFSSKNNDFND